MAERGGNKGTATAVGSLIPAEEALKALKLVQDAISERQRELDRLRSFAAENSALTKLVRQLPDEISHQIMVPFGSAAFFPGQIIHTNEFMVLLGDGYYAERTSKQTVEILKRREKSLQSQIEALKASLLDLEAEAKFFDSTASEAKEGIVEIREEYIEEYEEQQEGIAEIREEYTEEPQKESKLGLPDSNFVKTSATSVLLNKEEEHARIMARLDELEKEELEAESASGSDEDEDPESEVASGNDEDEDSEAESDFSASQNNANDDTCKTFEKLKTMEPVQNSSGRGLVQSTAIPGGSHQNQPSDSFKKSASETGRVGTGDRKSFTGSVIEHAHGLTSNQPAKGQPSKPVSRFKMMKGNR